MSTQAQAVPRYVAPAGTFDQPFTWVYDASQLVNGANAINQSVRITAGYGDFILRRIVGLNRVIPSGKWQLKDASGNFQSSDPIVIPASDFTDMALPYEMFYPEKGQIRFDLYGVNLSTFGDQIAFQGVRRSKGTLARLTPQYPYKPKPYTYQGSVQISLSSNTVFSTFIQRVTDFDFDLQQIMLMPALPATLSWGDIESGNVLIVAVQGGPAGNNITFSATAGVDLTVSVSGNAIAVTYVNVTTTAVEAAAAINANPAAAALVTAIVQLPSVMTTGQALANLANGSFAPLTNPSAALLIYDAARSQISNAPVLDIFCDGSPAGLFQNGAVIPPLSYPRNSNIRIDFHSIIALGLPAITYQVLLVGQNRIPC